MEPTEVLKQHLELCNDVHQLLLEENTWLKVQKKVPEMQFLDKKKTIVERLELSLANLKKLKPEFFSPFDDSKNLLENLTPSSYKFFIWIGKMKNFWLN